jgi:hypothetical protein
LIEPRYPELPAVRRGAERLLGNLELIAQKTLNLKDDQIGEITLDGAYKISLTFHSGPNPGQPEARLTWKAEPSGIAIEAWAWNNSLGESLIDPIQIARNNNTQKGLLVNIFNRKMGNINNCLIDLYED